MEGKNFVRNIGGYDSSFSLNNGVLEVNLKSSKEPVALVGIYAKDNMPSKL